MYFVVSPGIQLKLTHTADRQTGIVKKTDCKGVARNKNVGKTKTIDKYLPTFLPTKKNVPEDFYFKILLHLLISEDFAILFFRNIF